MRQYYNERYSRDVHASAWPQKLYHENLKFYLKRNLLILDNFSPQNIRLYSKSEASIVFINLIDLQVLLFQSISTFIT